MSTCRRFAATKTNSPPWARITSLLSDTDCRLSRVIRRCRSARKALEATVLTPVARSKRGDVEHSVPTCDRTLSETINRGIEKSTLRLVMGNAVHSERFDGRRRALDGSACSQKECKAGERTAEVMRDEHGRARRASRRDSTSV